MPRQRTIDPEFWSDEELGANWSRDLRLFYIGLWNFADDAGRFRANENLLKSQIFPYDMDVTIETIKSFKERLSKKIEWYENESQKYGWLKNFRKHQTINRPTKSKILPSPDDIEEDLPKILRYYEISRKPHGNLNEGSIYHRLYILYNRLHKENIGVACSDDFPLVMGIFKQLIPKYSEKQMEQFIQEFFAGTQDPDCWWADKASITVFRKVIPQLIGKLRKK